MKELNITKIRGGISWIIPIQPLPREFRKKTINEIKTNVGEILNQEGNSIKVLNPDFRLYDTCYDLINVSGNIQGNVSYHTANPPVHTGCMSWPSYFNLSLNVPDERYNSLKKSLTKVLHPVRSAIFGF